MGIPVNEKVSVSTGDAPEKKPKTRFRSFQLGIWEVVLPVSPGWDLGLVTLPTASELLDYLSIYGLLFRLFGDIYALAPRQFVLFTIFEFAQSFEGSINLYLNSQILDAISSHLKGEAVVRSLIVRSLASRVLLALMLGWLRKNCERDNQVLKDRVKFFFMEKSMHTLLTLDPTTAEDPDVKSKMGNASFQYDNEVWSSFEAIIRMATALLKSFSQIALAFALIRQHASAPVFFALCVLQPLLGIFGYDELWGKTHIIFCINKAYERLAALHGFAYSDRYRVDRLSDGVAEFIEREFKKSREELGDVSTEDANREWSNRQSFVVGSFYGLMNDFPMIYFALRILFSPKGITFSSLAISQEAASSIQWTIYMLTYDSKSLARQLSSVKNVYARFEIQNKMKDGVLTYPRVLDESVKESTGMELEFRNVSFKYPGTTKPVLEDLSFKIKPGQMVVIVGVNGSGKSSTIKLFNRLYDPTEGEILVDGLPLTAYKLKDVRRAMAILRQDHDSYPLSLRLNVALGAPEREMPSDEEIQEALKAGGADTFVEKLPKKADTVLDPVKLSSVYFEGEALEEMNTMVEEREKITDVSGGESQRLAAARVFMRLNSGGIRFLAADEPTSALDPEGEFALFSRLRQERGGKTVVFITHRFGHLTKYADLILVMKDGRLVESGNHIELVEKDGEYKRLHDVQAQAFLPTTDS
ncbi:P-loop containing nucleoside triphosphate hydrolase protein [Schizopora paradoxa]|uniref:p-loop containing nucleoside triphosphate hydrolase protein n=1 Tax=Schizopora paradoxa TaxID=27342 RepID=A0A0H2RKJ2_9AGAM|nr:P-loop containing nucleoside triphosphate hydrolase protein [Schizopora paradoxa]